MTTETTYLSHRSHYPIMDELYALTISNLIKVDQKLTNIKF
jgi:hypothetical protein